LLSIGSPFAKHFGLKRVGIHHELLPPGRRTSWPHAEENEEEFVFVIDGHPDVWIDGILYRLGPGDAVGFPPGTGIAHTFINNTTASCRLLVVGEASKPDNKGHYPINPDRNRAMGGFHWHDVPDRLLGGHNGLPDARATAKGQKPRTLTIRTTEVKDAEVLYSWRQEPTTQRYNPLDNLTLAAFKERLAGEGRDLKGKQHTAFRWMIEQGGTPVGSVALSGVNWRMSYAEIGYTIAEAFHGRGFGTEAVARLVETVFAESDLVRLIANISTENVASWRLVERLGFVREGTLRQHYVVQGRRVDEHVYGLMRTDRREEI
jgi:uncharacterized cupin superfamily protein/RimJ/RimL family protein N-acetyltransferase